MVNMEQYNILKKIVTKMKTSSDALELIKKFDIDDELSEIIKSIIINNKYETSFSNIQMDKYMYDIYKCKYKEDANELINNLVLQTDDIVQIRTFNRIAQNKPAKPQYITMKDLKNRNNEKRTTHIFIHQRFFCL